MSQNVRLFGTLEAKIYDKLALYANRTCINFYGSSFDRENIPKTNDTRILLTHKVRLHILGKPNRRFIARKHKTLAEEANRDHRLRRRRGYPFKQVEKGGEDDIDNNGMLIEKSTGKPPSFVYGFPFPKIDPKDSTAAEKIMENHSAQLYSLGNHAISCHTKWVGERGEVQLEVKSETSFLFYQQRRDGPLANRRNLLFQQMIKVIEPFKLRGSNQMIWAYNDLDENTGLIYLPSLRRVRKISIADSSDAQLGSDMATDDYYGWIGKNATMKWRLIGEKTLLMPFSSAKKVVVKEFPDGAMERVFTDLKLGHEIRGWKRAPWYPVDVVWSPVTFWIIEARPKNNKYSYGKQILYVDKGAYTNHIKEIFDQKGNYWKSLLNIAIYQVTATGKDLVGVLDLSLMIDDKTNHSTCLKVIKPPSTDYRVNLPLSVIGPQNFTEDAFIQTTK